MSIAFYVDTWAALKSFENKDFELSQDSIRTWKLPDDLNRYREVLRRSRPEVVVETGTAWGGSALWFAAQGVDVITIDIRRRRSLQARTMPGSGRITWINGASTGGGIFNKVRRLVAGKRVMVSLDSDHTTRNVIREITLYSNLVSPGCYLVVEDGIFELLGAEGKPWGGNLYQGGPLKAIEATLAGSSHWTRDVEIEQLSPVTHNPAGWWRKNV